MEAEALKRLLKEEAHRLGFPRVGFATCEPFTAEADHLEQWFRDGGAEQLPYLDQQTLLDPRRLWPQARSALVGFFPYARPEAVPGAAPDSLKLSRYLWGPDYHMLLKPRLAKLLALAQSHHPHLEGRVCVDTAPLMERALATRAGLGWQGKHTLLITGRDGSYGFLGVLLLSEPLPPDPPFLKDHCGTCTRCLEACPTAAISPFRVDPNRCLTTWTIETDADPPPDIAEALGRTRWAAGCDVCQEVCPWNRAPVWGDEAIWGRPNRLHDQPAESLRLGAAQWRVRTRRTALRRVRLRHWRRTVEAILGPSGPGEGFLLE